MPLPFARRRAARRCRIFTRHCSRARPLSGAWPHLDFTAANMTRVIASVPRYHRPAAFLCLCRIHTPPSPRFYALQRHTQAWPGSRRRRPSANACATPVRHAPNLAYRITANAAPRAATPPWGWLNAYGGRRTRRHRKEDGMGGNVAANLAVTAMTATVCYLPACLLGMT